MNENISSAANMEDLQQPSGTSDDLQVLIARAQTDVDSISKQAQEVAANAATVALAEKQASGVLEGEFNSEVHHPKRKSGAGAVACTASPPSGTAHELHTPEPRRTLSDSTPA